MKKLLSICFLSILLSMMSLITQAQNCCMWLENMQPQTLTGIVNAPNGLNTVTLNNAMSPVEQIGQMDTYQIRFANTCNLPANTKVSVEWKLYRDGQLVNGNLSDYADFKILTKYARLNMPAEWLGGTVRDGHGTCASSSYVEGFPGAMQPHEDFNSYDAEGYMTIGNQYLSLDYFNLPFFDTTETKVQITWRQVGHYSLVISLRERIRGTDWTSLYWNAEQNAFIGGHQSRCGRILASDSIHELVTTHFNKEVCDNSTFDFGSPLHTFSVQGDYNVIFGVQECGHFRVDSLDTLHFFVRQNPQVVVSNNHIEKCFGESFTQSDLSALASYATPDAVAMFSKEIQWSTDGITYTTTVPTPATAVGTYHFYVRQVNTYNTFGTPIVCEGTPITITYIVHPIPAAPIVNTANDYYCLGATASTVGDNVTASEDCQLHWSLSNDFATEITDLIPSTATAGAVTYYVYQVNTVTGCYSKDSNSTVTVTVYPLPVVNATATLDPAAGCLGADIDLSATSDLTSYLWSTDATTANTTVTPTVAGNYFYAVTVTQEHLGATCQNTAITNTVTINPIPAVPTVESATFNFCNEDTTATATVNATVGADGTTCNWYLNGSLVYTGSSYPIALSEIRPSTNIDKTVTYYVSSYNENTTCESEHASTTVTINFHQTPELSAIAATPTEAVVCPGTTVNLSTDVTTAQTESLYVYTWLGDFTSYATNTASIATTNVCDAVYNASVYVTDANGCKSQPVSYSVTAGDHVALSVSPRSISTDVTGCTIADVPAGYTTVAAFDAAGLTTITDNCSNLETVSYADVTNLLDCKPTVERTYTLTDHCGNSTTFVQLFTVKDETAPVFANTSVQLQPVHALGCSYDAPSRATMIAAMKANFPVTDNCTDTAYLYAHAQFLLNGVDFVGQQNIFANPSDMVLTIAVKVDDKCGNTLSYDNFYINRPAAMSITANSITVSKNELCLHDTVQLSFNNSHIMNATSPYSYSWTAVPNDGTILYNTLSTAYGVPATSNTNYVYTVKVTDTWGCDASASTGNIYVIPLPTVTISPEIHNGATFPLCPNYGVLTVKATATSNISDPTIATYAWSGESVNIHSIKDTTGVYIIPTICDTIYTAHVTISNARACKASASYSFRVKDVNGPVVSNVITDSTLTISAGCQIKVPDFRPLFNATNVSDNCYEYSMLTFRQNPAAGTIITANTPVTMTISDRCGVSTNYVINANIPTNYISVAVTSDNDNFCGGGSVNLTATPTNGVAPVSYVWSGSTATTGTINVTPAEGTPSYTVTATDVLGCQATASITLHVNHTPVTADLTLNTTPDSYCHNANNVANISNGTISVASIPQGYSYKMTTDAVWHASDYVYTGLFVGTYSFDLKSDNDCLGLNIATATITTDSNNYIRDDATVTTPNYQCVEPFDGTITVTNPAVNYTYEVINIPNSAVTYVSGSLIFNQHVRNGLYTIHVTTDKFCNFLIQDISVVDARTYPTLSSTDTLSSAETSCASHNGSFTLNHPEIGTTYTFGTLTYTANSTDPYTFNNLTAGSYNLHIVTAHGCDATFMANVPAHFVNPSEPTTTATSNTMCTGTPNGTITVTNPILYFTYEMEGTSIVYSGSNVVTFNNLSVGSHQLKVISDLGCSSTFAINKVVDGHVNPGVPTLAISDNTVCVSNGSHPYNGIVVITPSANYTYTLKNSLNTVIVPSSANTYSELPSGNYTMVSLDNATGCSSEYVFAINDNLVNPTITAAEYTVADRANCEVADGSITIHSAGSEYDYTVRNASNQVLSTLTGLDYGNYTITKTNVNTGCDVSVPVTILDRRSTYDFTYSVIADTHCDATGTGSITITSDGVENYNFKLGTDAYTSNSVFSNLDAATYSVTAYNTTTHCITTKSIVVDENYTYPTFTATAHPNTYCTANVFDGSITYAPAATYQYVIQGTPAPVNGQLSAGTYTVVATDVATGCAKSASVIITNEPVTPELSETISAAVANHNCVTAKDGSFTVTSSVPVHFVLYGTSNDTTTAATSHVYSELNGGVSYTVGAFTDKGCPAVQINPFVKDSASIYPALSMTTTPNTFCSPTFEHPGDGTIIVNQPIGPHLQYYFYDAENNLINVNYFQPLSHTMYHLYHGNYRVMVYNTVTGCSIEGFIDVPQKIYNPTINAAVVNNTHCNSPYTGSLTVSVTPTDTAMFGHIYKYSIDGAHYQNSNVFSGLNAGNYVVYVKDTITNCIYNTSGTSILINTEVSSTPVISIADYGHSNTDFAFCNHISGATLSASATSSVPGDAFTYSWSNTCDATTSALSSTSVNTSTVGDCTYMVTVISTVSGCTSSKAQTVKILALPNVEFTLDGAAATSPAQICHNAPFTLAVTPAAVSYVWNNGVTAQAQTISSILSGSSNTYTVTVTDNNGCGNSGSFVVIGKPTFHKNIRTNVCDGSTYRDNNNLNHVYHYDFNNNANNTIILNVPFTAVNGCDSIVTDTVVLIAKPTVNILIGSNFESYYCAGSSLVSSGTTVSVIHNGNTVDILGWFDQNTGATFNPYSTLTYAQNGHVIYYLAHNFCGDTRSADYTLKIDSLPTINADLVTPENLCSGNSFPFTAPTWVSNHHSGATAKWMISTGTVDDPNAYVELTNTSHVYYAQNGHYVKYVVTNPCGASSTSARKLVVDTTIIGTISTPAAYCAGDVINTTAIFNSTVYTIASTITAPLTSSAAFFKGSAYTSGTALTYADNGKNFYYQLTNRCGTTTTNSVVITVNDDPEITTDISDNGTMCVGSSTLVIGTPTVVDHGSTATGNWQIQAPGNTSWSIYSGAIADLNSLLYNGWKIRYYVSNTCGADSSNILTLNIHKVPTLSSSITAPAPVCAGAAISLLDNISVNQNNGTTVIAGQYEISADNLFTTPAVIADGATMHRSQNGYYIRYHASNDCGDTYSNAVQVTVNDTAGLVLINSLDLCVNTGAKTLTIDTIATNIVSLGTPSNDAISVSRIGNTITVTPHHFFGSPVTFTVTSAGVAGCGSKTQTVTVVVDSLPAVAITDIPAVCAGQSITPAYSVSYMTNHSGSNAYHFAWTSAPAVNWAEDSYPVGISRNGNNVVLVATNNCGTSTSEAKVAVVYDTAHLAAITTPQTLCANQIAGIEIIPVIYPTNTVSATIAPATSAFTVSVDTTTQKISLVPAHYSASSFVLTVVSRAVGGCGTKSQNITIHVDSLPTVTVSASAVCAGEAITPVPTISINSHVSTGNNHYFWQETPDVSWHGNTSWGAAFSDNGRVLGDSVINNCGVSVATFNVVVNDTAKLVLETGTTLANTVCKGSDLTLAFNSNMLVAETTSQLAGLGLTLRTNTNGKDTISGTITAVAGTYTVTVKASSTNCSNYDKTLTFTIKVTDKPVVTLGEVSHDTVCFNTTSLGLPTYNVINNGSSLTSEGWIVKLASATSWASITALPSPITLDYDSAVVARFAVNNCGADTASYVIRVSGSPTIASFTTSTICSGSILSDALSTTTPAVTLSGASRIISQGWEYKPAGGSYAVTDPNAAITASGSVRYFVNIVGCGTSYSSEVNLTVSTRPEFTSTIASTQFTTCSGSTYTLPNITYNAHNAAVTDTLWQIVKNGHVVIDPLTNATIMVDSLNNATVRCIIINSCGSDTIETSIVVNALPVPVALNDTIICVGGTAIIDINPGTTALPASYSWTMNGAVVSTSKQFNQTLAPAVDPSYYNFVCTVRDAHGCVGTDAMRVKVSSKPQFIFKNVAGAETHTISSNTSSNMLTKYSYTLDQQCWTDDQLVYLEMTLYRNGVLMRNDATTGTLKIDSCISPLTYSSLGEPTQHWYMCDSINWLTADMSFTHKNSYYRQYNDFGVSSLYFPGGYHYPDNYMMGSTENYNDFYLHFLYNRPVSVSVAPFKKAGNYTIVYKLYSTTNNTFNSYYYHSAVTNGSRLIGGSQAFANSTVTLLTCDTFNINVTGPDFGVSPASPVMPTITPEIATQAEAATINVYPNPAVDEVNADIKGITGGTIIRIVNLSGKVLYQEKVSIPDTGIYQFKHSMSSFVPGIYFIYVQGENVTLTKKLVVTK